MVGATAPTQCALLTGAADTDESDSFYSDGRQDLKRKVQYARGSDPDFLSEPRPYKKVSSDRCAVLYCKADQSQRIEHAGYKRYILQRNPPRFDPDGDIVEGDDEYEDEDDLEAVQENPYADIQIESARICCCVVDVIH